MKQLCMKVRMSRQNYYKERKVRRRERIDEAFVVALVRQERYEQPRVGTRKLQRMLKAAFKEGGIRLGRDRIFEVLRKHGMLVPPLKRSFRTTEYKPTLPVFKNLIREKPPMGPNEQWVVDMTYIRTDDGFSFLAVIMDRYSRKIVGHHCCETLDAGGCLGALRKALAALPPGARPTHHSDRGCQYASHQYVGLLRRHGLAISMTEENHCYENAHAERVIGILKQEFGLGETFRKKEHVYRAVDQGIHLYNTKRLHTNLGYKTPEEVHENVA